MHTSRRSHRDSNSDHDVLSPSTRSSGHDYLSLSTNIGFIYTCFYCSKTWLSHFWRARRFVFDDTRGLYQTAVNWIQHTFRTSRVLLCNSLGTPVYVFTCTHIYMYIYIHIHIHIHAHTHTCKYTKRSTACVRVCLCLCLCLCLYQCKYHRISRARLIRN